MRLSLNDVIEPQRSLDDGKWWDDSDAMLNLYEDTGLRQNALSVLCEANVAGAALPAGVVAFMARHGLVHRAECAAYIDDDQCFLADGDLDLSVDDACELAALLRDWDIQTAFAGGSAGGGGAA